jgi:hypothetical protein
MRLPAILLILALVLAGCDARVIQLNPGAPVPWFVGDPSDLRAYAEARGGTTPPGTYFSGLYDREAKVIYTARSFDLNKRREAQQLGWQLNEFCELVEDCGDPRLAAYLVTGASLDAICGDLDDGDMLPESEAMVRAMIEAHRAAKGLKP